MADKDDVRETHDYFLDVPMKNEPFELRGCNSLDWGLKNRLSNIFDPKTGSLFVLVAVRNIIRISTSNNFSVTSLRALIESIHSSVGKPQEIKPVPI